MTQALAIETCHWREWSRYADAWSALADRMPGATFFVSGAWMQTWLESFGASLEPKLLVFRAGSAVVATCMLVRRTMKRGPFSIRRVYLNAHGEDDRDSACTEFDTLVCEPGREAAVARALRTYLEAMRTEEPWDELVVSAAIEGPMLTAMRDAFHELHATSYDRPSFYVDLDEVRASGKDYTQSLASRLRTTFRQSVKRYGEHGDVRMEIAQTSAEAHAMLTELAILHQKGWADRGAPGSFASDVFFTFHRRLIDRCFDAGQIQLLRVVAGDTPIGALYNFIDRGKVYFYQCGFNYALNPKLSPGLLVQVYAIRHAAAAGLAEYDLMAGDVDYKRKLAAKHRDLHWFVWQAPGVKMRAFELLRDAKHWADRTSRAQRRTLATTFRSLLPSRS